MLITHDLGVIAGFARRRARDVRRRAGRVRRASTRSSSDAGHPYTQALIAAVPRLGDARATTLPSIPGVLPRADAIPRRLPLRAALPARRRRARSAAPLALPSTFGGPGRFASPATSSRSRARRQASSSARRSPSATPSIGATLLDVRRPRQGLPRARRSGRSEALAPCRRGRLVRHLAAASRSASWASPARASRPSPGSSSD